MTWSEISGLSYKMSLYENKKIVRIAMEFSNVPLEALEMPRSVIFGTFILSPIEKCMKAFTFQYFILNLQKLTKMLFSQVQWG